MNKNPSTPAATVAALQQEIDNRIRIVRTISDLNEQVDCDRICGSWLSTENTLSAVIRRIGNGVWRALIFDHTLCYKRIVQDGIISLRRHRLYLGQDDGTRVVFTSSDESLQIGCYGRFVPEDSIRNRDDEGFVETENPGYGMEG